ncbi:TonB-dependent receptor [Croceibacterium ferulae]|uniref:TonB-dependent receptor n=1 Tax=Croceibacterium ferulae TaxID=1854641 RepID=UPI0019D4EE70|nr:TonB-dependent receptor [Croceibacterium ferulae]
MAFLPLLRKQIEGRGVQVQQDRYCATAMKILLPAVTLLALTTPALAEEAEGEPILVTAQRREQAAQDVGIALSVIDDTVLAQRGITNVNGLADATPSLEIEPAFGGGAPQFRLRGVGFQDYATNNAPSVGVYVNEVAQPVPAMTQGLLFDIARVEVLRGPQGTLYGRNTTGGAVNFVTNRPTDALGAGATLELGRFGALLGEAHLNAPLADGVSLRLAGATQQGGAYQTNRDNGRSLGDANRLGARALLAIRPAGSGFDALLDLHWGRDRSEAVGLYLLNDLPTRAGAGPVIPADRDRFATGWGISPRLAADTGLDEGAKPGVDNDSRGASARLAYDFGAVTLTSLTSYDRLDRRQFGDWDASASVEADTFFGSEVEVWSQELRLAGSTGALAWTAGAYWSQQQLDERYFSDFIDVYGTYARVTYAQEVESLAVFGQAELALSPQWKLVAGLRYEEETRELQGFGSAFGGAQALPPTDARTRMQPLTGKLALEWSPADDLLLYASASRGVKSGGFTTYNTGDRSGIEPFAPETLYAYELGIKSQPAPWAQVNAAAFWYDYRDQQVLSAVYGANGPVGRFTNADRSRIAGAEVELALTPLPGLLLAPFAGFKHGQYLEFEDLDVPASRAARQAVFVDRAGETIPFPRWSAGAQIAWELPLNGLTLTPGSTLTWRSRYPSWLGETYDIPAYFVANAELALAPADGSWRVALWGRNIFNREYDLTRNFFTSADIAQPARPASYGIRISAEY